MPGPGLSFHQGRGENVGRYFLFFVCHTFEWQSSEHKITIKWFELRNDFDTIG